MKMDSKRNRIVLVVALVLFTVVFVTFYIWVEGGNPDVVIKNLSRYEWESISLDEYFEEFKKGNQYLFNLTEEDNTSFKENPGVGFVISSDGKLIMTTGDRNQKVLTENFSEIFITPSSNELYYLELLSEDGYDEDGKEIIQFDLNAYKVTVTK